MASSLLRLGNTVRKRSLPLAIAVSAWVGCGSGADDGGVSSAVTFDTLPNGAVLVHNSAQGLWRGGEEWRAVELARFGAVEGADEDNPYVFSSIWDVHIDGLGRVYVLDRQANEVRVFDPAGRHVRTLGGEGEGPGEFLGPIALAFTDDWDLWVVDARTQRYTVYDSTGVVKRTYPREKGGWGAYWDVGFDDQGRWLEPGSVWENYEERRARRIYMRHDVEEGLVRPDTFLVPPQPEESSSFRIIHETGEMFRAVPFVPEFHVRFDGTRGLWLGTGESYRLIRQALEGDTLLVVEKEYNPVPVAQAEIDEAMSWVDELPPQGREQVDYSRIPAVKPAFDALVVDNQGYLWVSSASRTLESSETRGRLDVFDPTGRFLGSLDLEFGRFPLPRIVDDHLVAVLQDELDVPHVVLYQLEGRPLPTTEPLEGMPQ
jgi:hypothetical protein